MPLEFTYAALSPFYIAAMVIYAIYSLYKAGKKKQQKEGKITPNKPQPGKSIEEVLRELESRMAGTNEAPAPPIKKESSRRSISQPKQSDTNKPREKTVAEYKAENHSGLKKEREAKEKILMDHENDRLMHLERNELIIEKNEQIKDHYTASDMREAVILSAILNRPEY